MSLPGERAKGGGRLSIGGSDIAVGAYYAAPVSSIRLEPFVQDHLGGFREMLKDPDVLRFTRMPDPAPDGFDRSWFAAYEQGKADGTRMNFAIVDGPARAFLGIAVAPSIDTAAGEAELGYVVAPWARRRGVATEALRQLTTWAFTDLAMVRLQLLIDVSNEPSKRVAERCGYRLEGVLRSLYFKQDLRSDTESWSRLAGDS
ncbi:MAG: hypothetical protein QOH75_1880 [Actinomycetota bacterium]|nr:hypothetical protein [Actinomycetota bacterium]